MATVEFTSQFSKYMLLGFFEVAINQAKANADAKSPSEDPEQLMEMPVPDWPIKSGYFTKEGGNVHNWKKRGFVANNKKDEFTIDYYADE